MPASEKIAQLRERMKDLDPASPQYKAYEDIIEGLKGTMGQRVVVHRSPEPEICESCQ